MKDVFGREWEMVTLKDKKWSLMSDWEKLRNCIGGLGIIIFMIFYNFDLLLKDIHLNVGRRIFVFIKSMVH